MGLLPLVLIVATAFLIAVGISRRLGRTVPARTVAGLALGATTIVVLVAVLLPASNDRPWHLIRNGDAALVSTATADLHAPPAFSRRATRCHYAIGANKNLCFSAPRSIVLNRRRMGRLVAATGATPQPKLGGGLVCLGLGAGVKPPKIHSRLYLEQCAEAATSGPLLLDFIATSIVRLTPDAVLSARQVLPRYFGGTQVEVIVIAARH